MLRIGIYPRKSVYRDNSDSVSVQIKMCKEYAGIIFREEGKLDFHIYSKDEGFSGKNMNRPSFQELMSDVVSDKLDIVIVYKLDRISRNVKEFSAMYETFQKHNVNFISVKESFDTSTPIGRTVMYILAAFAQLERENTSERVTDNMKSLGASGFWTGGTAPAGMTPIRKKVDGKTHSYLMVDSDNIERVKLLYQLILDGYSITGAERYCRDNHMKSQAGKYLNSSQIHRILTNPVYCQNNLQAYYYFQEKGCTLPDKKLFDGNNGLLSYGKTKTVSNDRQLVQDQSNWTISIGIHEWVMSSSDWIAVQDRLSVNKQVRTQKHMVGILKGALYCKCGRKMHNRVYIKNDKTFGYYFCQIRDRQGQEYCDAGFVKIDTIDSLFVDKLKQIQLNKDFIAPQKPPAVIDAFSLKKEIRQTEAALQNLTEQLQNNVTSPAAKYIISQMENLDQSLDRLHLKLKQEELRESTIKNETEERASIYSNICYLLDNFETMTYQEKNELIKKSVRSCVFDGETLDITF